MKKDYHKRKNKSKFYNREISWLEFNRRVLQEGQRKSNPLLERVKFLAIVANNLDEFFEVRIAGLLQKVASKNQITLLDGHTPLEVLNRLQRLISWLLRDLYRTWNKDIIPELKKEGYAILSEKELTDEHKKYINKYYDENLHPILTPIKIDSAHPFPIIINKALAIAVLLSEEENKKETHLGIISVPRIFPRIISLPGKYNGLTCFIFLSDIIQFNIAKLFKGYNVENYAPFRITRNSNLYVNDEEDSNLLKAIESELHNRKKGEAVRLEIHSKVSKKLSKLIRQFFKLDESQVNRLPGPVNFHRVMTLVKLIDRNDLKFDAFIPQPVDWLSDSKEIFAKIKEKDRLIHLPYESFDPIIVFLQEAAKDEMVHAIKITLYRTDEHSPIIKSLIQAAQNGKEVTVIIELKARFDEASNITWAKQLIENDVNVVFGLVGLKTHSKLIMIVRREKKSFVKYVHVGTGNFNTSTAKLYTDLSLLTTNKTIANDVLEVFNILTSQSKTITFKKLLVSPDFMLNQFLALIKAEMNAAKNKQKARIIFKVNALQEPKIIEALYEASQAGVEIIGSVRGICCLRAGEKGLSENIKITSLVGKYLEHSRIYYFENAINKVYIGSADWMTRNLRQRVEVITPILNKEIEDRILKEILEITLQDNSNTRKHRHFWKPPELDKKIKKSDLFSAQETFQKIAKGEIDNLSFKKRFFN